MGPGLERIHAFAKNMSYKVGFLGHFDPKRRPTLSRGSSSVLALAYELRAFLLENSRFKVPISSFRSNLLAQLEAG
jgi:hypothetical protein